MSFPAVRQAWSKAATSIDSSAMQKQSDGKEVHQREEIEKEGATLPQIPFDYRDTGYVKIDEKEKIQRYYQQDGSTNPANVTSLAKYTGNGKLVVTENLEDNENARVGRIAAFDKIVGVDTNKPEVIVNCTDMNSILLTGEEILCSITCDEVIGLPASTTPLDVNGVVRVSLIKSAVNGNVRLQFSAIEGSYEFSAKEDFMDTTSAAGFSCCCLIVGASARTSAMSMKYRRRTNYIALDCQLSLEQSVIDAIVARTGLNEHTADVVGDAFIASIGGNFFSYLWSCSKLLYICSTGQYRQAPVNCCTCKCSDCFKCCDCCSCCVCFEACWKKSVIYTQREVSFEVTDHYKIGEKYTLPDHGAKDDKVENKLEETKWLRCPFYVDVCGCYEYPSPLFIGEEKFKGIRVMYCCSQPEGSSGVHDEKYRPDKGWEIKHESRHEISVILSYRHPIDRQFKTCRLIMKSMADKDVDEAHRAARAFVAIMSNYRSIDPPLRDYPIGVRQSPYHLKSLSGQQVQQMAATAAQEAIQAHFGEPSESTFNPFAGAMNHNFGSNIAGFTSGPGSAGVIDGLGTAKYPGLLVSSMGMMISLIRLLPFSSLILGKRAPHRNPASIYPGSY